MARFSRVERAESFTQRRASNGGVSIRATSDLEIDRRVLAAFVLDFIADLLTVIQALQARTLDCADMDEDVFAAAIGLNEAKSLLSAEPLHCS